MIKQNYLRPRCCRWSVALGVVIAVKFTAIAQINVGNNSIFGTLNSVAGGETNAINFSSFSTIGGGKFNTINLSSVWGWCFIGGGLSNATDNSLAVIAGGQQNINSGSAAFIGAGSLNAATANSAAIAGGQQNTNSGSAAFIGGGLLNLATTNYAAIAGGRENIASGDGAFLGGGYLNDATGNYTTLGGGYNNAASGYIATVGGGTLNTAPGFYSTIGGGYQNATMAAYTFVGGGTQNTTTNSYSAVAGGWYNSASGEASFVGGGSSNLASRANATVGGGYLNNATTNFSTIPGGAQALADKFGQLAYASGRFSANGDAQGSTYILRRITTTNNLTELFLDGSGARMTLKQGSTWTFDILVTGRSNTGNSAGYQIRGLIENVGGTTAFVGAPVVTVVGEDVLAWDTTVVADNTNDALVIKVTGDSSTIRWVANVRTAEVVQ